MKKIVGLSLTAALAATLALAGPAIAQETKSASGQSPTTITAPMYATPLTPENAEDYGYEIRRDIDGSYYGVPIGTAAGSKLHATDALPINDASTRGTVTGTCGSSYVTFDSQRVVRTGYYIKPSFGDPLSHGWHVAITSSIDAGSYDLSGWAPIGWQSWNGSRTVQEIALNGQSLSAVAGGYTVTSGGVCTSGGPTASIVYYG